MVLPPPLQVSTPLHTVDTCASLHTLSISLLFPSVIKIYLSTPPAILVEALFLQGTHLHIPLLEAACHGERPSLCHPTSCTLLLCWGLKVPPQDHSSPSHSQDRFMVFSHTLSKAGPCLQPSTHFCPWLSVSSVSWPWSFAQAHQLKALVTVHCRSMPCPRAFLPHPLSTVLMSCHAPCLPSSFSSESISDI